MPSQFYKIEFIHGNWQNNYQQGQSCEQNDEIDDSPQKNVFLTFNCFFQVGEGHGLTILGLGRFDIQNSPMTLQEDSSSLIFGALPSQEDLMSKSLHYPCSMF